MKIISLNDNILTLKICAYSGLEERIIQLKREKKWIYQLIKPLGTKVPSGFLLLKSNIPVSFLICFKETEVTHMCQV